MGYNENFSKVILVLVKKTVTIFSFGAKFRKLL